MKRATLTLALLATIGMSLAACGSDPLTRGITGGAIGAGAGAGVSALTHNSVGKGALIGGGVGALGGALTSP